MSESVLKMTRMKGKLINIHELVNRQNTSWCPNNLNPVLIMSEGCPEDDQNEGEAH